MFLRTKLHRMTRIAILVTFSCVQIALIDVLYSCVKIQPQFFNRNAPGTPKIAYTASSTITDAHIALTAVPSRHQILQFATNAEFGCKRRTTTRRCAARDLDSTQQKTRESEFASRRCRRTDAGKRGAPPGEPNAPELFAGAAARARGRRRARNPTGTVRASRVRTS